MSVKLPIRNSYSSKDQLKANLANKFIGRGSQNSSTNAYVAAYGDMANCGNYSNDDVVFVSVEGNRRNRKSLDTVEIDKAISMGVEFITDTAFHRNRSYNVGERELANYLYSKGYVFNNFPNWGSWVPKA